MGMSSSQARLLNLTARMHQIEYKAAKIEAQKLQMANQSRRVYNNYLRALDSRKVQYQSVGADGSIKYTDATLAKLMNGAVSTYHGEASANPFLVKNIADNLIYVTREFAGEFGISEAGEVTHWELEDWLEYNHAEKHPVMTSVDDYTTIDITKPIIPVSNNCVKEYSETPTPNGYSATVTNAGTFEDTTVVDQSATTNWNIAGAGYSDPTDGVENITRTDIDKTTIDAFDADAFECAMTPSSAYRGVAEATFSKTFKPQSTKAQFTQADLNKTVGELIGNGYCLGLYITGEPDVGTLSRPFGRVGYTTSGNAIASDESKTLKQAISERVSYLNTSSPGANLVFDETTGTITAADGYNFEFWAIAAGTSSTGGFSVIQGARNSSKDAVINSSLSTVYGTEQNFDFNTTKINAYLSAFTSGYTALYKANSWPESTCHAVALSGDMNNMTYKEYFDALKASGVISDYNYNSSTGKLSVSALNDTNGSIMFSNTGVGKPYRASSNNRYTDTIKPYIIDVRTADLAENVYLAKTILGEYDSEITSLDDYNANHNSKVSSIKATLDSVTSDVRLAQFASEVSAALDLIKNGTSVSDSKLSQIISQMGSLSTSYTRKFSSTPDMVTESYNSSNEYGSSQVLKTYEINIIRDAATSVADPATTNTTVGQNITINSASKADIASAIAFKMYQKYGEKTPAEYVADVNSYRTTKGLTDKQIASIGVAITNASALDAIATNVKDGSNIASEHLNKYVNTTDKTYLEPVNFAAANNVSFSSSAGAAEQHTAEYTNADSVFAKIAYTAWDQDHTLDPASLVSTLSGLYGSNEFKQASLAYYIYNDNAAHANVAAMAQQLRENGNISSAYTDRYADKESRKSEFTFTELGTDNKFSYNSEVSMTNIPSKGNVIIPDCDAIASNLVVAMRKTGNAVYHHENDADYANDIATVSAALSGRYSVSDNAGRIALANINDAICNYLTGSGNEADIHNIANHLYSGAVLNLSTSPYENSKYDSSVGISGQCKVTYEKKDVPTGEETWTLNDRYYDLYQKWQRMVMLEGNRYKIVTDEQANSEEFVSDLLTSNEAVVCIFDESNMECTDTNVAVETDLREVDDEKELKKAEAQYEADMLKIDKKERRYDAELAKLDTERNAIKSEMETLKNVAKENVERTFKLFG